MLYLLLAFPLVATFVLVSASTCRHMRFGNRYAREPFPFRYALACALVETSAAILTKNPLGLHRARMRKVRAAEARRDDALARAMERHPAGRRALPVAVEDDFIARARATHAADQMRASIAEARHRHPAAQGAAERTHVTHGTHASVLGRADAIILHATAARTAARTTARTAATRAGAARDAADRAVG